MTTYLPYAEFCDHNDLKRIDASPEDHLRNLDLMATALLEERAKLQKQIADRCECCGGTERKP